MIDTHTDMGGGAEFHPAHAVIVYRANDGSGRRYVTVSDFRGGTALSGERPATESMIREVIGEALPAATTRALLHPRLLGAGAAWALWYSPPAVRTLFWTPGRGADDLSGRDFPQPPLLWKVVAGQLSIAALSTDARPDGSTVLCHAPYWNVYPDGSVCTGTMARPDGSPASRIDAWEAAFYASAFSHPNCRQGGVLGQGGVIGLWRDHLRRKRFDTARLVSMETTLEKWIR